MILRAAKGHYPTCFSRYVVEIFNWEEKRILVEYRNEALKRGLSLSSNIPSVYGRFLIRCMGSMKETETKQSKSRMFFAKIKLKKFA